MTGPPPWSIYRHPRLVRLVMAALYRARSAERLAPVAAAVRGASVLELFAGQGQLAALHDGPYLGFERSAELVAAAQASGRNVLQADVLNTALPDADFVVLVDGLYQLLPPHHPPETWRQLLRRAQAAARRGVLLVEPVDNLLLPRPLRPIAAGVVDAGDGPLPRRFTESQLAELARAEPALWTKRWRRDRCLCLPPRSPGRPVQPVDQGSTAFPPN